MKGLRLSPILIAVAALCVTTSDHARAGQPMVYELENCEYRGDTPPGLDEPIKCDRFWSEQEISQRITLEFLYSDGWRLLQIVRTADRLWHADLERPISDEWLLTKNDGYRRDLEHRPAAIKCIAALPNRGNSADVSSCTAF